MSVTKWNHPNVTQQKYTLLLQAISVISPAYVPHVQTLKNSHIQIGVQVGAFA